MTNPTTPYADTLTTLLTKPSSEIVAWLRTEQAKGVLPVNVAVTVLIELVSRMVAEREGERLRVIDGPINGVASGSEMAYFNDLGSGLD